MNDILGVELKIGQHVAVARPAGTNACLMTGVITDLKEDTKKFRIELDGLGSKSNWINVNSYYGSGNKVVVLNG